MIDGFAIENKKAIVTFRKFLNGYERILCIVLNEVLIQGLAYNFSKNRRTDAFLAFGKLLQDAVIHKVVY